MQNRAPISDSRVAVRPLTQALDTCARQRRRQSSTPVRKSAYNRVVLNRYKTHYVTLVDSMTPATCRPRHPQLMTERALLLVQR